MSKNNNELHGDSHVSRETIGKKWAALLREHWPRDRAKNVARAFGCDVRTAQSWLCGQTPQLHHFIRAAQLIGFSRVVGVLFPDTDLHSRAQLHDDLLELRSRLDRLSQELGELDHGTREDDSGKGC